MKLLKASFIVAGLFICGFGQGQTPGDIQILQATYGADSAQMDVTAKVQSLVQSGQTNVRVGIIFLAKILFLGK